MQRQSKCPVAAEAAAANGRMRDGLKGRHCCCFSPDDDGQCNQQGDNDRQTDKAKTGSGQLKKKKKERNGR